MMHRLTWFVYFCTLTGIRSQNWNTTIFSAPPSGLPVRRVYIHNRPVYVRQMFMTPQRIDLGKPHENTDSILTNDETLALRFKRSGFPPIVPFAAPAASAAAASSASASAAAPYYSYAPAAPQTFYQASVPSSFPAQSAQVAPAISPAIAAPAFVAPQPLPPIQPLPIQPSPQPIGELPVVEPEVIRPNYPLPSCYTNNYGFMCCNNEVEDGMVRSFNELRESRADWSSCNLQQISNRVQQNLEREYNTTFEVVVGVGDYASRSHFWSNLICKVELDGKFILSYATPHADAEDYPEGGINGGQNGEDGGSYRENNNNGNTYPSSLPNDDAYDNEASATPTKEGSYKKFNFSFRI
ncbi:Ground-like domain-containing protein [Aphelenchoides besseyi]|nr:Ground-like domain-containing protein [Aphelenchoides besseyi]